MKKNLFSNALMVLGVIWLLGTHWFGITSIVVGVALIVLGAILRVPS
ncbi:MAG: hypothetical protein MAG453_02019 [Calditrichaeota bacterium]|nr:hypothetical protein [Calditrichota bacterium]